MQHLLLTIIAAVAFFLPDAATANSVRLDVPYYYQYDNKNEPKATCGLTSGAMLLSYMLKKKVTPDSLYEKYGKGQGQSPSQLAALYKKRDLKAQYTYNGTRQMVRNHLISERPVVMHGKFTTSGHIILIVGYDKRGFIVHDPAGGYDHCYGCGFHGKYVRYNYNSSADRAMGVDGHLWFSVAGKSDFSLEGQGNESMKIGISIYKKKLQIKDGKLIVQKDGIEFHWNSIINKIYTIQRAKNIDGNWGILTEGIKGNGSNMTYFWESSPNLRSEYFRIFQKDN